MRTEVTVVIEQPFDFVGAVLVPVAAILVSSLLAIWIAAAEQRRARKAELRNDAVNLIRSLNDFSRELEFANDRAAIDGAHGRAQADLRAFSARLPVRDAPVARFLEAIFARIPDTNRVSGPMTLLWLSSVVEDWMRGRISRREFEENMPSEEGMLWMTTHPSDWQKVLNGEPPERRD